MKKLMKAIAFATVMCMLLSVSAFAAAPVINQDKTINVIVEATEGQQVALLMVAPSITSSLEGLDDEDIIYIDQKEAAATGNATFTNVNIGSKTEAAVWVGYDNAGSALYLGNAKLTDNTVITVSGVTVEDWTQAELGTDADGAISVVATLNYELAEGDSTSKLVFALAIEGEAERRYSAPQNFAGLSGPVQVAATFSNGSEGTSRHTAYTKGQITPSFIILTVNNKELYSDKADAANKLED